MFTCVCRLCVPNITSSGVCLKKLHLITVGTFVLDTASKFALFSVSGLKDEKLIRKQTYTKTEAYKLYSRVFWIHLSNIIKNDPYNFKLYRFKIYAFFETQCRNLRLIKLHSVHYKFLEHVSPVSSVNYAESSTISDTTTHHLRRDTECFCAQIDSDPTINARQHDNVT